jgi:hypothetical protein
MKHLLLSFPRIGRAAPFRRAGPRTYAVFIMLGLALMSPACGGEANTNSNVNVISTTNTGNNTMPQPINLKSLSEALKIQLRNDAGNVLTPEDWENDVWLDQPIGRFYQNDSEFSKDSVCKVTEALLLPANKKLTDVSKRALRNSVNEQTLCKSAVSSMLDATLDIVPIIATN